MFWGIWEASRDFSMSEHVKNCQITTAMCHLSHLSHLSIRHVVLQALVVSRTHVQDLLGGMPGCTKLQKQNTICFCLYIHIHISSYINIYQLYLCLSLSSKRFFSALKTPLEPKVFWKYGRKTLHNVCALLALLNLPLSHRPTVSSSGHGMCQRSPLRSHSSGSSRSLSWLHWLKLHHAPFLTGVYLESACVKTWKQKP